MKEENEKEKEIKEMKKMTPLIVLKQSFPTFHTLQVQKTHPLSTEPSSIAHNREYLPSPTPPP